MKDEEITVKCRKCGTDWPSTQLKMDLDEKMMVCPSCIRSKKAVPQMQKPGLDASHASQPAANAQITPTPSQKASNPEDRPMKVKQACKSCGFKFVYNADTKTPRNCPYCSKPVIDEFPVYRM